MQARTFRTLRTEYACANSGAQRSPLHRANTRSASAVRAQVRALYVCLCCVCACLLRCTCAIQCVEQMNKYAHDPAESSGERVHIIENIANFSPKRQPCGQFICYPGIMYKAYAYTATNATTEHADDGYDDDRLAVRSMHKEACCVVRVCLCVLFVCALEMLMESHFRATATTDNDHLCARSFSTETLPHPQYR